MKRVNRIMLACLLAAALALTTPVAAEAKKKKQPDTPGCVTRWEFNHIRRGMTDAQVRALVDTPGALLGGADNSLWLGDWVHDGYWEPDGYWDDTGYFDEFGNWMDTSTWVDTAYWVDSSYWDDHVTYRSQVDTVRAYKKCRSFDRGRSRIGINFDDYSSAGSGMRVYLKVRSNPAAYFGRTGDPVAGKSKPDARSKAETPKPTPTPTEPKPAPNPTPRVETRG